MDDIHAQARSLLAEKAHARIVELLRPHLSDHPDDAEGWELLAAAFCGMSSWQEAERAAGRVVSLRPGSVRDWSNWGMTLRKCGRWEEAEDALTRALRLDPGHARAQSEMEKVRAREGRRAAPVLHVEAESDPEPALTAAPAVSPAPPGVPSPHTPPAPRPADPRPAAPRGQAPRRTVALAVTAVVVAIVVTSLAAVVTSLAALHLARGRTPQQTSRAVFPPTDTSSGESAQPIPQVPAPQTAPQTTAVWPTPGAQTASPNLQCTIGKYWTTAQIGRGSMARQAHEEKTFLVIRANVANHGQSEVNVFNWWFKLECSDKNVYEDAEYRLFLPTNCDDNRITELHADLLPGGKASGDIVFEVAQGVSPVALRYSPPSFSP